VKEYLAMSDTTGVYFALVMAVIVAVMVAFAAFLIKRADKATIPAALIASAIAFAGTLTLVTVVVTCIHVMLTNPR
jgi:hypothetical protein